MRWDMIIKKGLKNSRIEKLRFHGFEVFEKLKNRKFENFRSRSWTFLKIRKFDNSKTKGKFFAWNQKFQKFETKKSEDFEI